MSDQGAKGYSMQTAARAPRDMHVLVISRNLPPLTGGMERLVANAIKELAGRHRVTVIGPPGCAALLPAGVMVREAAGQGAAAFLLSALPCAAAAVLAERPDIVLAGSGLTAPIARIVALIFGVPYAVMIHGLDVIFPNRIYQSLFVPCLRAADALIANSEHTAQLALAARLPATKTDVLHPGVTFPAPAQHGFRERFAIHPDQPLLLSVGRIVRRKGLPAFIAEVMPALSESFPGLVLAVVGDEPSTAPARTGSELDEIRRQVVQHELQERVVLCGRVTDELLHAAYAEADALVFPVLELPGDVEGFGMVAVEAAAHGLPTFGFRAGGVPDAVIDGKTGELVANGDYAALRNALARHLGRRPDRTFRTACLAHAKAHGWSRYGERLGAILGWAVDHAQGRRRASRDYQYGYSALHPEVNDPVSRERKATTALAVLEGHLGRGVAGLRVADVGGSGGVMAARFAREGACVTVIDIDEAAIAAARERYGDMPGLDFRVGDAMALDLADVSIDVVLCCHVYEHVPDAARMMAEIRRVLRPGGVCYFSAGNRLTWREPHYGLPLLSVLPRFLAHRYLRLFGRGFFYHEQHLGYGGLRRLTAALGLHDYTRAIVEDPARFGAAYMIPPGSLTQRLARLVISLLPQLFPNFIWLLERPADGARDA